MFKKILPRIMLTENCDCWLMPTLRGEKDRQWVMRGKGMWWLGEQTAAGMALTHIIHVPKIGGLGPKIDFIWALLPPK